MKRKKRSFTTGRFRKRDHSHNLLVAVSKWVKSRGGQLLIVGPVEIQDWAEGMGKFKVAVGCLGRKPVKKEEAAA